MAGSEFSNQIDPEVITASVQNSWANEAVMLQMAPQVFVRDTRPTKGTLVSQVRNTFFQGTSGQAVGATETISAVGRVQSKASHPVVRRYGSIDEDDVIAATIAKDVEGAMDINAEYAENCRMAGSQWLEDSIVAMVQGTGASLTDNQSGTGAVFSLATLAAAKGKLGDQGIKISSGLSFCRSELYWIIMGQGVVAATSNTFGAAMQDMMVRKGIVAGELLGTVLIPSDKIALAPASKHYLYMMGPQSIILRANDAPKIESARKTVNGAFGTITNMQIEFALGFRNTKWVVAGSDKLTDVDLATSANWALADTDSKYVSLVRFHTHTS